LFVHDLRAGGTLFVASDLLANATPSLSADGRYVAYDDYRIRPDPYDGWEEYSLVIIYDTASGGYSGTPCEYVQNPVLSADGRYVAFNGGMGGLTGGAIMLYDRFPDQAPPETDIVSGPCGELVCAEDVRICWQGSDNETPAEFLEYLWRVDGGAWQGPTSDTCITLSGLADGQHLFEVKARDRAGNGDPTPAQCSFTVDAAPPSVSVASPANGATVKGVVSISASASDVSGIERVEFYARGELLCTDTSVPYSCDWDTRPLYVAEGPAEICVRALNSCGHSSERCFIVTVDNTTFDDVPKTASIWRYVEALAGAGMTVGCSTNPPLFCPTAQISRAQMAVLLCRVAGKGPLNRDTPSFCDVPKTNPYYGWIERLADPDSWGGNPPTIGCTLFPCKQYCPWQSVKRDEMAAFLVRATGKQAMPSCSGVFADVGAYWACPYIERLAGAASWPGGVAVTAGCALNPLRYCPKSPVTRGQMAVFLVRAFGIPL
jgi:hypothetical protein